MCLLLWLYRSNVCKDLLMRNLAIGLVGAQVKLLRRPAGAEVLLLAAVYAHRLFQIG